MGADRRPAALARRADPGDLLRALDALVSVPGQQSSAPPRPAGRPGSRAVGEVARSATRGRVVRPVRRGGATRTIRALASGCLASTIASPVRSLFTSLG